MKKILQHHDYQKNKNFILETKSSSRIKGPKTT